MLSVAPAIRAIFPLFSDIVLDAALDASGMSKDDPAHQPFLPGYRQLMDGFREVIFESLDGPEREKRTKYITQTVPSLLQQTELEAMVDRTVSFSIRLTNAVVLRLPAHQREQATAWFAEFFGSYMAELVRVGRASSAR